MNLYVGILRGFKLWKAIFLEFPHSEELFVGVNFLCSVVHGLIFGSLYSKPPNWRASYCWLKKSGVYQFEVSSLSHCLQGFIPPRSLGCAGFLPFILVWPEDMTWDFLVNPGPQDAKISLPPEKKHDIFKWLRIPIKKSNSKQTTSRSSYAYFGQLAIPKYWHPIWI